MKDKCCGMVVVISIILGGGCLALASPFIFVGIVVGGVVGGVIVGFGFPDPF